MTPNGIITKGVGGLYTVRTDGGVYVCPARGRFRVKGVTPLVGDYVEISVTDEAAGKGYLLSVSPRKNELTRPRAANIDVITAVFSLYKPEVSLEMIDDVLITTEFTVPNAEIIICINKADVTPPERVFNVKDVYAGAYEVYPASAATGDGLTALFERLSGKTAVVAGPSGVGKSSLINALLSKNLMETGMLSRKTERGRHTTRHAELFELNGGGLTEVKNGGLIADTPGFSSTDASIVPKAELAACFPEFRPYLQKCRYRDCGHVTEDGCAVKERVGAGISVERYERYVILMDR